MTYTVSGGMLTPPHSLTFFFFLVYPLFRLKLDSGLKPTLGFRRVNTIHNWKELRLNFSEIRWKEGHLTTFGKSAAMNQENLTYDARPEAMPQISSFYCFHCIILQFVETWDCVLWNLRLKVLLHFKLLNSVVRYI